MTAHLLRVLCVLALAAPLGACERRPGARIEQTRALAAPVERNEAPRARVHALLINGGDRPQRNYQSHLLHVRELIDLLLARGVRRDDITVFASDGEDPAPDLAVLDEHPERRFWLIQRLPVGARLRPEVRLANSSIDGFELRPATRGAIGDWFENEGAALEPGATLLVYVTDHGNKNPLDLANNTVVLWGEELDVATLRRLLAGLPPGVRKVLLMSQCFSGAFAGVIYDGMSRTLTDANTCGFFASPADRFAYGCYPENRGKKNVGHSFHFFDAVRVLGSFDLAHDEVLLTDRTPDVPNRASGRYLDDMLRVHALSFGLGYEDLADSLLTRAWADEALHAQTIARIDEIGRRFGAFGPRTFAELADRTGNLPQLRNELAAHARRWNAALDDVKAANFERFLAAVPDWNEMLSAEALAERNERDRRALRRRLLIELSRFTNADGSTAARLRALRSMAGAAGAAAYRMDVRVAAALRIRDLLARAAGEAFLDHYASHAEQAAYESLRSCEAFELKPDAPMLARLDTEPPLPSMEADTELLAAVLPGWLGVQFRPIGQASAEHHAPGAVVATAVEPSSPAERAGLVRGDVILGPPGEYFTERNQIREWTMTSLIGRERDLDVVRDGRTHTLTVRIGAPPSEPQ